MRRWQVLARQELLPLLLLVLVAAGVWVFAELSEEVFEGDTATLDQTLLLALREPDDRSDPIGPRWLEETGRDFTALGAIGVLAALTLAVCGFLFLAGKKRTALLILIAVVGGYLGSNLLKHSFQRPRPDLVPHGAYVYTTSFPSGHSMMAASTYLTIGVLLARVQSRRRLKAFILVLAALLTLLVGLSRVYLGVHWPTDVLAGWTAGGVWALLCWAVALRLQSQGAIEQPVETDAPDEAPTA